MQVWEKVKCAGCEDVWLSDQDTGTLKHSEEEREIEDGQGMFAEPFGTLPFGYDHYLSHFKEKYYVPSLLWNAIVERGYMYPGFIWAFIQKSAEEGREPHHLEHSLRSFFKKRKPFLLEELERMESCVM